MEVPADPIVLRGKEMPAACFPGGKRLPAPLPWNWGEEDGMGGRSGARHGTPTARTRVRPTESPVLPGQPAGLLYMACL